jgi:bifunctional enzyme CysN/CysC
VKIVIIGHVDHGKSTIIGRLLADTGALPEGKIEEIRDLCVRTSKPFEYAFLLDALKDERTQGITIDVARVFFKTEKRDYIVMDAPGHVEFLKNMITGASKADAGLLVIDAKEGIRENSKRHAYLLSMLGIKQMAVLVNKMDLLDYSEKEFKSIVTEFSAYLSKIGVRPTSYIPVSGFHGEGLKDLSLKMPWYKGLSVLQTLDQFDEPPSRESLPFRMPVQDVYKFTGNQDTRRIVAGTVESGSARVGDELSFLPSGKRARIKSIEEFQGTSTSLRPDQASGFTLDHEIYVSRGEVAVLTHEPRAMQTSTGFSSNVFWLGANPLSVGKEYVLRLGTAKFSARVRKVEGAMNAATLDLKPEPHELARNEVGSVSFELSQTAAFDLDLLTPATSRFVLIENFKISGGGIIHKSTHLSVEGKLTPLSSPGDSLRRGAAFRQRPCLIVVSGGEEAPSLELAEDIERGLFFSGRTVFFLRDRISPVDLISKAKALLDAGMIAIVRIPTVNRAEWEALVVLVKPNGLGLVWTGDPAAIDFAEGALVSSQALDSILLACREWSEP